MDISRLREVFSLDAETGILTWKIAINSNVNVGERVGSLDNTGYLRASFDGKRPLVHRIVFAIANGHLPNRVDHRNRITTDNRPANLRAATCSQNQHNAKRAKNNTSGVKGVSWFAKKRKWRADCAVNRKGYYLGLFDDMKVAESAVRAFREQHHGEFARHE